MGKRWSNAAFHYNQPKKGKSNEWLTPPELLKYLGKFDLDPCASVNQPWKTAKRHYTIKDDGLKMPWRGRVWCNPPYGDQVAFWAEKMGKHRNGLLLVFGRIETRHFFSIWKSADAVFVLPGRLSFHYPNGKVSRGRPAASIIAAYGKNNVKVLKTCGLEGALLQKIIVIKGDRIKQKRPRKEKKND